MNLESFPWSLLIGLAVLAAVGGLIWWRVAKYNKKRRLLEGELNLSEAKPMLDGEQIDTVEKLAPGKPALRFGHLMADPKRSFASTGYTAAAVFGPSGSGKTTQVFPENIVAWPAEAFLLASTTKDELARDTIRARLQGGGPCFVFDPENLLAVQKQGSAGDEGFELALERVKSWTPIAACTSWPAALDVAAALIAATQKSEKESNDFWHTQVVVLIATAMMIQRNEKRGTKLPGGVPDPVLGSMQGADRWITSVVKRAKNADKSDLSEATAGDVIETIADDLDTLVDSHRSEAEAYRLRVEQHQHASSSPEDLAGVDDDWDDLPAADCASLSFTDAPSFDVNEAERTAVDHERIAEEYIAGREQLQKVAETLTASDTAAGIVGNITIITVAFSRVPAVYRIAWDDDNVIDVREAVRTPAATIYNITGDPAVRPVCTAFLGEVVKQLRQFAREHRGNELRVPALLALDEYVNATPHPELNFWLSEVVRKTHIKMLVATQERSDLHAAYGKETATSIEGNFNEIVVLGGSKDDDLADWVSKKAGDEEVWVNVRSYSKSTSKNYDTNGVLASSTSKSDSYSDAPQRVERKRITTARLFGLPERQGIALVPRKGVAHVGFVRWYENPLVRAACAGDPEALRAVRSAVKVTGFKAPEAI